MLGGVEWGASDVLARTLANLERCGLRYRLLRRVWDVDRPEELERLGSLALFRVKNEPG